MYVHESDYEELKHADSDSDPLACKAFGAMQCRMSRQLQLHSNCAASEEHVVSVDTQLVKFTQKFAEGLYFPHVCR